MFPCLHGSHGFPEMARLQAARSCAISLLSRSLLMSSTTHSFQVFLPRPRLLESATSILLHTDTQLFALKRSTCPNHLSLLLLTTSTTLSIPNLSRSSSVGFLAF